MAKVSAGLLLFRKRPAGPEFFLVHPGGPFWKNKDDGAWSIAKGEVDADEEPLDAAKREFKEETGSEPTGPFIPLTFIRQKGGKIVHAWAVEGDLDPANICSNTFTVEWPPRSGKVVQFPEVDRAAFFPLADAKIKIISAQMPLLDELKSICKGEIPERSA